MERIKVSCGEFRVEALASISGWVYRGLGTRLRRVSWLLSSFKAGIVIRSFMTAFELPNPAPEMEKLVLFEGIRISFNCFASTRLHFFFFLDKDLS